MKDKPQDAPDNAKKKQMIESIVSILHAEPRSSYRKQKCSDRLYFFTIKNTIHITAWFDEQYKNNHEHNVNSQAATLAEVLKVVA